MENNLHTYNLQILMIDEYLQVIENQGGIMDHIYSVVANKVIIKRNITFLVKEMETCMFY